LGGGRGGENREIEKGELKTVIEKVKKTNGSVEGRKSRNPLSGGNG